MASTKTEHLTSLSFNLTDMKAQLDSIPASVQEAALKAQKAWDDNFNAGFSPDGTMGSGAGGNGGRRSARSARGRGSACLHERTRVEGFWVLG